MRRPYAATRGVTFEPIRHRTRRRLTSLRALGTGPDMNATEIFTVDVAAVLAEHWCKVLPFCLRVE